MTDFDATSPLGSLPVSTLVLDGAGRARTASPDSPPATAEAAWVRLDFNADGTRHRLESDLGLDPLVVDALLAEETRPRTSEMGSGILVILRGVNLNPGADPEDMVSIRLWMDGHRLLSVQLRPLAAVADVEAMLAHGRGPRTPFDLLLALTDRLTARMAAVIDNLDDEIDGIEENLERTGDATVRSALSKLRHRAIVLRRYLAPQREALALLSATPLGQTDGHRGRLREISDRSTRYVESLDLVRERAALINDEIANRLGERMNKTMYLLTVVASLMLPLGFLTGLLGINVGGIPLAENALGFVIVSGLLLLLAVLQIVLFRRLGWL